MRTDGGGEKKDTESIGPESAANKQAEGAFCSPSLEDAELCWDSAGSCCLLGTYCALVPGRWVSRKAAQMQALSQRWQRTLEISRTGPVIQDGADVYLDCKSGPWPG